MSHVGSAVLQFPAVVGSKACQFACTGVMWLGDQPWAQPWGMLLMQTCLQNPQDTVSSTHMVSHGLTWSHMVSHGLTRSHMQGIRSSGASSSSQKVLHHIISFHCRWITLGCLQLCRRYLAHQKNLLLSRCMKTYRDLLTHTHKHTHWDSQTHTHTHTHFLV